MTSLTDPLVKRLERIARRDNLTDTALSLEISAATGKRNHILMKRLRAGNVTARTINRVAAWLSEREATR